MRYYFLYFITEIIEVQSTLKVKNITCEDVFTDRGYVRTKGNTQVLRRIGRTEHACHALHGLWNVHTAK